MLFVFFVELVRLFKCQTYTHTHTHVALSFVKNNAGRIVGLSSWHKSMFFVVSEDEIYMPTMLRNHNNLSQQRYCDTIDDDIMFACLQNCFHHI